ncbi:MAG TPA: tetratricopeptide repeat protein [Planctomycetota bacterium]|nr:tetratricopeptide repeat protein [Planctomycetota bacterium]
MAKYDKLPRAWRLLRSFALLALFVSPLAAYAGQDDAGDEDYFQVRKLDEVYFINGDVMKGTLSETDEKDQFKIKSFHGNKTRMFKMSEVKEIKRRQLPDDAMDRLSKECIGNPIKALKVAKQAMARFNTMTDKVIAMLERESSSRDPELLAFLCEIYLQSGKNAEALKTAEILVGAAPNKAKSFTLRGLAYLAQSNNADAEKDLDKAQKLAPDDPEILVARANILLRTGRAGDARNVFTTALNKNPNNVAAHVGQGQVQLRQGEFLEAEESFKKALSISAEHRLAKVGLAFALIMNKKPDDAYAIGERLLSANPKDADAYAIKAFSKFYTGDKASFSQFEREAREALKERPNQARLLWAWAAALERQAKIEELSDAKDAASQAKALRDLAEQKLKDLAQLDPADGAIQFFLAERKFRSGDYNAAMDGFKRTVTLAPTYAPAHAALGATYLNLSNWQSALESYNRAALLDPKTGEYLAGKGLALLKMQRFEQAEDHFKQALDLDAKNVTARCGLGYVKNFAKNKAAALDFFQQALAVDGNCAYAADALSKIYKQDDLALEYVTFEDEQQITGWKSRGSGGVRNEIKAGKLTISGVQGSTSSKAEYYKELRAEDFARIEADIEISAASPVMMGVRIGAAAGSGNFMVEVGKDDTAECKVRYTDFSTPTPTWSTLKTPWPADGKLRIGLDTDDLKTGKLRIWINGKQTADVKLVLQKPTKITAGVFVQAPGKETVSAGADNLVLVTRLAPGTTNESSEAITIINDGGKKPEEKAPEPAPTPEQKKPEAPN